MWKRIAAGLSALVIIGAGVVPATAAEQGGFRFSIERAFSAEMVQSARFTLTTPDGTVTEITPPVSGQPIDRTVFPAGTLLNAEIVMQPRTIAYQMNDFPSGSLPLSAFEVTSSGEGNNGTVTYTIKDRPMAGNSATSPQQIRLYGMNVQPFNSISYNLNGGQWVAPFEKGVRLRDNQQYITPLQSAVRPADPAREGYAFLGWSGTSALLEEHNHPANSGLRAEFTANEPYGFDEVDPNIPVGFIRGTIVNLRAEWGRLVLTKTAAEPTNVAAGEDVVFTLTLANDSKADLTDVRFQDDTADTSHCPTAIAAGETVTCEVRQQLTQAQVDAGALTNTATATAATTAGVTMVSDSATATVQLPAKLELQLTKAANPAADVRAGETVTYSFTVRNTGNVTLSNVSITDPMLTEVTCPVTELAPQAETICTGTYIVSTEDAAAGSMTNTATAVGVAPNGGEVRSEAATAVVSTVEEPEPTETGPTNSEPTDPQPTGNSQPTGEPTPTRADGPTDEPQPTNTDEPSVSAGPTAPTATGATASPPERILAPEPTAPAQSAAPTQATGGAVLPGALAFATALLIAGLVVLRARPRRSR